MNIRGGGTGGTRKKAPAKKKVTRKPVKKKIIKKKPTKKKAVAGKKTTKKKAVTRKPTRKAAPKRKATRKTATRKAVAKKRVAKKAPPKKKAAKRKTTKSRRKPNPAFMKPLVPSEALAAVVGRKALPRTEVVKKLWAYIKKNKLQDNRNRRNINADAKLKKIFGGKETVNMFEMTKLVNKHIK